MTFTLFDIVIFAIMTGSSLLGFYKGMISITLNLFGFIASIIAAILIFPYMVALFSGHIENSLVVSIVSGVASYIISLLIFTIIISKIVSLFANSSRGAFDRFLGLITGIIRGGLIALILFAIVAVLTTGSYSNAEKAEDLVLNLSSDQYPDWLKNSTTMPYLETTLKELNSIIPEEIWSLVAMPQNEKKQDEDIIDSIKKQKEENQR